MEKRFIKIYLASSWRNGDFDYVWQWLTSDGFVVYNFKQPQPDVPGFSWQQVEEGEGWKNWSASELSDKLKHPAAIKHFNFDFSAMKNADCCVLLLPCGRSAHFEAGWFAGQNKPVFCLQYERQEAELMYNLCYSINPHYDALVQSIKNFFQDENIFQ